MMATAIAARRPEIKTELPGPRSRELAERRDRTAHPLQALLSSRANVNAKPGSGRGLVLAGSSNAAPDEHQNHASESQ